MLASPLFLLSSALSTTWAMLFHLLFGKGWVDLLLYWFLGLIGFIIGQAMADVLHLPWFQIGQTHIIEATLTCWIAMLVARWLKV